MGDLPEDVWQGEEEKGYGRVERREIRTAPGLEWLEGREAWEGLTTVVQYRTFRTQKGKETVQIDRYYISSGDFSAEEFLRYIRGHWPIENHVYIYEVSGYRDSNGNQRNKKHPVGKVDPETG
jgi:predicted transposase YbfD/YdcC